MADLPISNNRMLKSHYKRLFISISTILCFGLKGYGQHHISKYEVCWAFFHPFAALKIKHHLPKAMEVYKTVKLSKTLDTFESGGKLDAFRHTYTMAYLGRMIKGKKLKKLGIAHEKGNKRQFVKAELEDNERPDSLACEMDLRNNEVGIQLGTANKKCSNEELKEIVIKNILSGNTWYLKRNSKGQYVNCAGEPIDFKLFMGKWSMPKCLIKTNES